MSTFSNDEDNFLIKITTCENIPYVVKILGDWKSVT